MHFHNFDRHTQIFPSLYFVFCARGEGHGLGFPIVSEDELPQNNEN